MPGEYVIGLDCGTSGIKAAVWSPLGELAGLGRVPLDITHPGPGRYEQDPESWLKAVCDAVRTALDLAGAALTEQGKPFSADAVAGLSISHQRETFVPFAGKPLYPALLWMDERAALLIASLKEQIDPLRFREITGKTLSANLTVAKIDWLRRYEAAVFSETEIFHDVQSYILHALTGRAVTGYGSADPTGLFDMAAKGWSGEILDMIGLEEARLPAVKPPGSIAGTLLDESAEALGLPRGLPVIIGLGDGQSSGLGCGIAGPGESYLSLGTSIVSGSYSSSYIQAPEFRTSFGGIPDSYFLETVMLSGAYTMEWYLNRFLPQADEPDLRRRAGDLPEGSEGLMLVPYWSSAMNPYWDSSARGITVGWTPMHSDAHMYRAILEGTAYEQRLHTDGVDAALRACGIEPVTRYVVSGGGCANELWLKIIADVTGREIQKTGVAEAGALGAGILAAAAAGLFPDVASAAAAMSRREETVIEPDPAARRRYDAFFSEVYRDLYPALAGACKKLTALIHQVPDSE